MIAATMSEIFSAFPSLSALLAKTSEDKPFFDNKLHSSLPPPKSKDRPLYSCLPLFILYHGEYL